MSANSEAGGCLVFFMIVIWIACIFGYVDNIIKLAGGINDFTNMEILRIIGIFAAPLGVVLGFM